MGETLIQFRDVAIRQQDTCVLEKVSMDCREGEFIYVTGKVGSGKSSLLKAFYGEADVTEGEAYVLGTDMRRIRPKQLSKLRRKLGIIFQDFQLLTDRNVHDNLDFVLRAIGWRNRDEINDRIEEALKAVGMTNKGYKWPNELSGGEQQRVVIARAILNSPRIILADEPTGNLDAETGHSITALLHDFADKGTLVVMATHNIRLIRVFPGKVLQCEGCFVSGADRM